MEGPHNLSKSVRVSHDPFISVLKGEVNCRACPLDIIGRTGVTDEQDTDVDVRVVRHLFVISAGIPAREVVVD